MATLTVWKFATSDGADTAVSTLKSLENQRLIELHDAATVSWKPGAKKPTTRQLQPLVGIGATGGMFWGLLFGLIFFVPLLGAAVGAALGAAVGSLGDVGIDDDFISRLREQVTPGTSALFALTFDAVPDKVQEAFGDLQPELIQTNLSADQEDALRESFA
ncbi:DUF1269 domain-containing protein [Actinomycetospora endophytica]|uniref:DUF1269 domain-containing protein n=1 Tax=Actinomycetospora endophytica TaxID=2291215 RepID=A0ABS8P0P7_9PSEU|nr:DUF1269 domain-containing protein [Actinomycetospora endophytica]MCD2191821.1 DUF1269 domain-containing protein [Actinomycetospora endophytica]